MKAMTIYIEQTSTITRSLIVQVPDDKDTDYAEARVQEIIGKDYRGGVSRLGRGKIERKPRLELKVRATFLSKVEPMNTNIPKV
jgi:hypothetical protein